jgi:hypothetical protein
MAKAKDLRNETLVFLIRRTHRISDEVCGGLLEELRKRILPLAYGRIMNLDDVAAEEIVMNVEIEILEVILTKERSRNTEYLEIAFGQAIDRLTVEAIRKQDHSPMGHRNQIVKKPKGDESIAIKQLQLIPDDGPSPADILLNLEDENGRHQLLLKACNAVKDRRHLEAVIRHHGHGEPITSKKRGVDTLVRRFRQPPRKIKYWLATGLEQMRAALGIEK